MSRIEIAFGRSHLAVDLPPEAEPRIIRKPDLPKLADPRGAIAAALAAPIGSASLPRLATGRRSACILICDITRPVPNHLFLRPMIEQMMAAGVQPNEDTLKTIMGSYASFIDRERCTTSGYSAVPL